MTNQLHSPPPNFEHPPQYPTQPPPPQNKGVGIASMVVGIVAIALAFIPVIGTVSFLLGVVAIGLGIFAIIKRKGKGQGIAGIVTGAVALIVALVIWLIVGVVVSAVDQGMQDAQEYLETEIDGSTVNSDEIVESSESNELPSLPQAYSALTIIGDEAALPKGEQGEVSVVAISEPERNTSFPFILQNRTDQAISRIEVTGRAIGPDEETLGTGGSHSIYPNVVLPGGYAFGYVYVDSSDYELPAGASIPDLRIEYTEGLGRFENIITLDIENYEELGNGDLTGDVANPHEVTVGGPISVDTVCLSADEQVTNDGSFADNDTVSAGGTSTWTISSYRETPACTVRLIASSGYEE